MSPGATLGVDLGTGRAKASLVAADGSILATARRSMPLERNPDGGGSYDPAVLVEVAAGTIRDCLTAVPTQPRAVGIASMAEAGVPLDREGRPMTHIAAWFDAGSAPDADALRSEVGAEALFARTGLRAEAKHTLARLRWLGRTQPRVMREMAAWAGVAELMALMLTGRLGTDASLACRTLAFNPNGRRWDAELLALARVEPERMPPVAPPGTPVGFVTGAAAARTGLPAGIPVVVAGHDHVVGALAVVGSDPDVLADSMGTAEVALLATDRPRLDDAVRRAGLSTGCHVLPHRAYVLGGLPASGGLLDWLAALLAPTVADPSAALATLADGAPMPSGLVVAPFLRGRPTPRPDDRIGLRVAGLRGRPTAAQLALGAVEGIAFAFRAVAEAVAAVVEVQPVGVRLYGGGSAQRRRAAVKSVVNPWPTSVAVTSEAVTCGAAALASVAAGLHATVAEAADAMRPRADAVPRDASLASVYDELYRTRYLPLAR